MYMHIFYTMIKIKEHICTHSANQFEFVDCLSTPYRVESYISWTDNPQSYDSYTY